MSFYSPIVEYYEDIFPVGQSQMTLLKSLANENQYILDAACGTGLYSHGQGNCQYNKPVQMNIPLNPDLDLVGFLL